MDKINFNLKNTEGAFAYKSDSELSKSHLLFKTMQSNFLVKIGPPLVNFALKIHFPIKSLLEKYLFNQFCGGTSLEKTQKSSDKLFHHGVLTLLDYGVEGEKSEEGFDNTEKEFLKILSYTQNKKEVGAVAMKISGIGNITILEKIQNKTANESEIQKFEKTKNRLDNICKKAFDCQKQLYIDAEESWIQDIIDQLVEEMMAKYNQQNAIVFQTAQMYRHDRLKYIENLTQKAKNQGFKVGLKIVRGAYLEKENDRAQKMNYPSPINPNKTATDREFNGSLMHCLQNLDIFSICIGTHNEESSLLAANWIQDNNLPFNHPNIVFAQLYGMSDNISFNLAKYGFRTAKYLPFGPLEAVLPYLFRRASENTSIAGQTGREYKLIDEEIKRRKKSK